MKPFDINNITRKNIQTLLPYKVWRDDYLTKEGVVFLDNCENNYGSPLGKGYERYPESSQKKLKDTIASLKNISTNRLVIGNGSDELIDLSIRCFCEPKEDSIIICEPTFGMFSIYAKINDVGVLSAPLNDTDFSFNTNRILNAITTKTKLIFICSPNNPTGTSISQDDIITICNTFNGIVVLDEAYIDFSEKGTMIDLTKEIPNLLVLQTFSKAWGLAALRIGVAIGNPQIITVLNKVRPPYNINGLSVDLLIKAISNKSIKDKLVAEVIKQKKVMKDELLKFSFIQKIIDSDGNYFLLKADNAAKLFDYLLKKQLLISNRSSLLNCKDYIRISIGTETENRKLLAALNSYK